MTVNAARKNRSEAAMKENAEKIICTFYTERISQYNEEKTEVWMMFRRKSEKRILELNPEEAHLAKYALLSFRNKLIEQGKPTEDVVELLLKIMK